MNEVFYLDTCIWLNLFKKEGDVSKGKPYWIIAKEFIEKVESSNDSIIVSTIVLKELEFKLGDKFNLVKEFFKDNNFIKIIKTTSEDYELARNYEDSDKCGISFYDYLHVAIAKRLSIKFITRDRGLIEFSKDIIKVNKPEELIS